VTLPADPHVLELGGDRPTTAEICDLIGWMRRLSDAGIARADPAELVAFHAAKHDLLARIQQHTPTTTPQESTRD
jgi:hypothetical protein